MRFCWRYTVTLPLYYWSCWLGKVGSPADEPSSQLVVVVVVVVVDAGDMPWWRASCLVLLSIMYTAPCCLRMVCIGRESSLIEATCQTRRQAAPSRFPLHSPVAFCFPI